MILYIDMWHYIQASRLHNCHAHKSILSCLTCYVFLVFCRPVIGGVDSKNLFNHYIMVWIEDKRLSFLELCKADKVLVMIIYIIKLYL